jgi:hypothetical protein
MHKLVLLILLLFVYFLSFSQISYLTEQDNERIIFSELNYISKSHSFYPYFIQDTSYLNEIYYTPDSSIKFLKRKLFFDDFYHLETKDLTLQIDPAFNLNYGEDSKTDDYKIFQNTRGIIVRGKLGKNLYFKSTAFENQMTQPVFLKEYINWRVVVPGIARLRYTKPDTFDCSTAEGELYWQVSPQITVNLGRGKKFLGYGYRSLFLSYNAPPYSYINLNWNSKNKKLLITSLWYVTSDIKSIADATKDFYYKGYGNINFLSYYPAEWLQVGLVESKWYKNKVDFSYFVPIAYWNSVFDNKNDGRIKAGFTYSIRLLKTLMYYGQWDFMLGQTQNGFIFAKKIKKISLFGRAEYNNVRNDYNLTHHQELFSNLNQFIDYATENTKSEFIGQVGFSISRFFARFKYNEISRYNFGDYPYQLNNKDYYRTYEAGIEINPAYRLQIFGRILYFNDEKWWSIGIRTNILGRYIDI